jgi:hypothetical protein
MPTITNQSPRNLVSDADLAELLRVSRSCIRSQRFKRRRGDEHWLEVDPIMLGTLPRYNKTHIEAWLSKATNN